ncbi:hypothetical protein [Cloacibacillus sp. An23]|uniref:hypothetical protein n=1 Tax=Cloacibacillus sp. An23 TaxID=1965591 RepID=UPI000B367374|nr:hypothetical protein [Cloacibacillus sp. An23]OUO94010.1 hypothetical protein B5F39_04920 [Cloacibacillus sp. An23]
MAELEQLECLLKSKSSRTIDGWRRFTFGALAAYLLVTGVTEFRASGVNQKVVINAFLCICGVLVLKFEKKVYASPLGFVKDTHTWFSHHREVLRWDEIRHVTLVTKGTGLTAFLEKDVIGWKLLFERNDMAALDGLFKKYAPKVKVVIKELGQR